VRPVPPVVAALLVLLLASPAHASVKEDLAAARKRADRAAAQWARAEAELGRIENGIDDLQVKATRAERRLVTLQQAVQDSAVRQYVNGGVQAPLVFTPNLDDAVRAQELARFVTVGAVGTIDRYKAIRDDLVDARAALRNERESRARALQDLRKRRAAAVAEVNRLARVQRELEARAAAERARRARAAGRPVPRAAAASRSGARAVIAVSGPWTCPVAGPHAFSNDYGDPRSGGRRHQGNDILAPRGTPVVANVGGIVRQHNSSLGGLGYYLQGDDGNVYFGTHLDSYGASGRVVIGTVIGRVGNSGNARGGPPHLHFEIHPGGGGPVNPYPTLLRYC
jgi:peptidoglycan LD-endopeptidase LytH